MEIKIKKLKNLMNYSNNEYKFLSPHIYKNNNQFKLLFCNREKKSSYEGKIFSATSKNFKTFVNKKLFLSPKKNTYKSYVSPSIGNLKNKKILFLEGQKQNKKSDIVSFLINKNTIKKQKNFKLMTRNDSFQSPFYFKNNKNNFLFYSKNKIQIECIKFNNNFKILKKIVCFKNDYSNEKYSIYSPSIFKIRNRIHMFYSAWTNKKTGNINYAYSDDGKKWIKKYMNIFKYPKEIQIISEPNVYIWKNEIYVFFEFKSKIGNWNISFIKLQKKLFDTKIQY